MHVPIKNVLITGSAVRVGRAVALRLAQAGWNIAIHCHSSKREAAALAREIRGLGRKVCVITGDLRDPQTAETLIRQARKELGPLTCLINNASRFSKDTLSTFTEASLAEHFAMHTFAPLRLIRHFAAQCPKRADNLVINIGDGVKGWSMSSHFLTYSLSKIALMQMTQLLAPELAPHIRINTIAPGLTLPGAMDKPGTFKKLANLTLLKRPSQVEELCDAVVYLLQARSLTGQCLDLSGGMDCPQVRI